MQKVTHLIYSLKFFKLDWAPWVSLPSLFHAIDFFTSPPNMLWADRWDVSRGS